jgi:hypothetical protein
VPGFLVLVAVLLPFFLWDMGAFVDDTLQYHTGLSASGTSYPIKSLGLGGLALGFGWVQHSTDPFPFSALQLIFGGLAFVGLLIRQWRNNTLPQVVLNYALLFFVFLFLSRMFNDNHLGYVLTWFVLSGLLANQHTGSWRPDVQKIQG